MKCPEQYRQDYFNLWNECIINPSTKGQVDIYINQLMVCLNRYKEVELATSIPWFVIGVIHGLEASFSLNKHLHNGDPLTARTVHVPKGKPEDPPEDGKCYTWEESAIDSLSHEDGIDDISKIEDILYWIEHYNGLGYRKKHPSVKSPYLWSFSNQYEKGKYTADGRFDPNAVSKQCGAATILKAMCMLQMITL